MQKSILQCECILLMIINNKIFYSVCFLVVIFLGSILPLIQVGVFARLLVLISLFLFSIVFWLLRSENNWYPEKFIAKLSSLVIFLSIIWPRYVFFKIGPLPRVNPYTIMHLVLLFVVLVSLIYSPSFCRKILNIFKSFKSFFYIFLIWLIWRFVACVNGVEPIISLGMYFRELFYLSSFLFLGVIYSSTEKSHINLFKIMIVAGLIVSIAGVYEFFSHKNIFIGWAVADEDGLVGDLLNNIAHDKTRNGVYRAHSVFSHPIVFAQALVSLIPVAVYFLFEKIDMPWKLISLFSIPLFLSALYMTGSRSGYIAVLISSMFIMLYFWLKMFRFGYVSKIVSILILPVILFGIIIGKYIISSLLVGGSAIENNSGLVRITMIENAISALSSNPLLGYGEGMSAIVAGLVSTTGLMTIDNYFLTAAVDGGYVSLVLFGAMFIVLFYRMSHLSLVSNSKYSFYSVTCIASVLALLVVFSILSIVENFTVLWLLISSLIHVKYIDKKSNL